MKEPCWIVKDVKPNDDFTLLITFSGGERKVFDCKPLLSRAVFAPLHNPAFFMLAKASCGTVIWNDDVDIAPEHLYERSIPVQ